MQFHAPVHGNESSFEAWVQTAVFRGGDRVYNDCPDEHDKSVGIRVIGRADKIKEVFEHPDGIQSIRFALEAYLNTLEASMAGIGIKDEHLVGTDEHTSTSDRFYYNVLLADCKVQLKVVAIEQFPYGFRDRSVMHHLKLS